MPSSWVSFPSPVLPGWWLRAILFLTSLPAVLSGQGSGGGQNQLQCIANAPGPPTLRGESYSERIGDIALSCTGGTPTAQGAPVPTVNITVVLNSSVTSRLYDDGLSEALLIVDEPGSGIAGTSNTQAACDGPNGVCAITGTGTGEGTYDGSTGRPNLFRGQVNANSVTFFSVPIDPPAAGHGRVFRFSNIRVNAAALYAGPASGATPVTASISSNNSAALPIANPTPTVGFVQGGLAFSVRTPDNAGVSSGLTVGECANAPAQRAGVLRFGESYGTIFAARTTAAFVDSYTSPTPLAQNVPGQIYNSESGFYAPAVTTSAGDFGTIGRADSGTRLRASFTNIPTGASVYVSANRVAYTNGNPAAIATGPLVARLIQNEATAFAPLTH